MINCISFAMRLPVIALALIVAWSLPLSSAYAGDYQEAVSSWSSDKDVGEWLRKNFEFDRGRMGTIQKRLKSQGPSGLLIRSPEALYSNSEGYCADAANFALNALNKIDPEHNARWVFIKNGAGKINHWVTGYTVKGKLFIMDYGAGSHWKAMIGIHGPYNSLDDYANFLTSLGIKGFSPERVFWREIPGQVD
ncbi:transglutaminase-like domain-containing protein [Pseudomonadota bacterium]